MKSSLPCSLLTLALTGTSLVAHGSLVAQQRPVTDISPGTSAYTEARISPDGTNVAYRVGGSIAAVGIAGGSQITIASGASLGSFLWSNSSQNVFYVDSSNGQNRVVSATRNGSSRTTIATVAGQTVELWDVDSGDGLLYGVRFDAGTSTFHLFELSVAGGALTDLISTQDRMSEVRIDDSDAFLAFFEQGTQPFDPISVKRAQADGTSVSDFVGASVGTFAEGLAWVDQGDTVVFSAAGSNGSPQILRVDHRNQQVEDLTGSTTHRRPSVSADGQWIVCESIDGLGGNGPALLPVDGGGVIELFMRTRYTYSSTPTAGGPLNNVAFSALRPAQMPAESQKLWKIELDGELKISPRAGLGVPVTFELPLAANEVGAMFLGLRTAPFTLNGIAFDFDLGAGFAILTIGVATNGALSLTVPIPPATALQGQRLDFQGLRVDASGTAGEWTRTVGMTIF